MRSGAGVRADPGAGTLTVFLPAAACAGALADLADNGRFAVTISRAIDRRSLQAKGGVFESALDGGGAARDRALPEELLAVDSGHVGVPARRAKQ